MKTCAKTIFPRKKLPAIIIRKKENKVIQIIHRKNGDFVDKSVIAHLWWRNMGHNLGKKGIKNS